MKYIILILLILIYFFYYKESKWVGLIYEDNSNLSYHVGTFKNVNECIRVSKTKSEELGDKFTHACLRDCNYDYTLGWDVCAEDAE